MNRALYIFSCLIIAHFSSFSQNSINDYKYIIVPDQFEFLKEKDQYQINSLTKFLFNKYGYSAFMQYEDLPDDLRNNRCLALMADVVEDGGLFKTKLRIDLKDCNGNLIQSSQTGETREKEYAKAYNFALRDAFKTFELMDYAYQANEKILAKSTTASNQISAKDQEEIARLKEELKYLKEEKVVTDEVANLPKTINVSKEKEKEESPKEKIVALSEIKKSNSDVLYAQAIDNGYQVVDSSPKVVMILYPTGAKDVFTVKDKNAIIFKKDGQWIYSENDGAKVQETILNIKF